MNFHPLVVHFPLVCLILYSTFELISLFSITLWKRLRTTKLILLFIGVATGRLALQTGEIAEDIIGSSQLVETHEQYGTRSYNIYLIIALIYALQFLSRQYAYQIPHFLKEIFNHRFMPRLIAIGAVAGVVLLTITGALGAAISHGPEADIIVEFVYNLVM